jgi:hypothetical protein
MKKIILALFLVFASANANAFTVIRDSEIEFIIRELTTPVYKVAGSRC